MERSKYYENQQYCCNPFSIEDHKASGCNLRPVSHNNIVFLQSKGIEWVTSRMKLCIKCCFRLSNVKNEKFTVTALPIQENVYNEDSPMSSLDSPGKTPSTGASIKPLLNTERIKALLQFLGIKLDEKASRMDASSSNYRASVTGDIYSQILTTIRSWFPSEVTDKTEDFDEILSNLKSAFANTEENDKKIEIIKLVPRKWSFEKIKHNFKGATQHLVNESKLNALGIKKLTKAGRPSHSSEVQNNVISFYLRDEISRPFPGLKDTISLKSPNGTRQNVQKRLLLAPLDELHNQYLEFCKNGNNASVSFTSFWKLRPKQCVYTKDSSAMNVCVCMFHENMKFLIDGLKKTNCFDDFNTNRDLCSFLTKKATCADSDDACHLRQCEQCSSKNMIDFVADCLDKQNIEDIKYCFWVTSPRCEIINKEENVYDFFESFSAHTEKFIVHQFKVEKQIKFIRMRKESLIKGKEIMCQMDFAENYSCVIQDSIQSHYFSKPQVTIHPFVIYYNDGSCIKTLNYIVISDIKKHNTISVYAFQIKLLSKLKALFPELEKIIYLSDGCAEQYKNKLNFKNLCYHENDFQIKAEWHFFPTSHGKGPCDGIGGNIKRMAREASIRTTAEINNAKQFFAWATAQKIKQQFKKDWEFIYATDADYLDAEKKVQERICDLIPIPGTKKYHEFIPRDERSIYASEYSNQYNNQENKVYFPLDNLRKRKPSDDVNRRRSSRLKNNNASTSKKN